MLLLVYSQNDQIMKILWCNLCSKPRVRNFMYVECILCRKLLFLRRKEINYKFKSIPFVRLTLELDFHLEVSLVLLTPLYGQNVTKGMYISLSKIRFGIFSVQNLLFFSLSNFEIIFCKLLCFFFSRCHWRRSVKAGTHLSLVLTAFCANQNSKHNICLSKN